MLAAIDVMSLKLQWDGALTAQARKLAKQTTHKCVVYYMGTKQVMMKMDMEGCTPSGHPVLTTHGNSRREDYKHEYVSVLAGILKPKNA